MAKEKGGKKGWPFLPIIAFEGEVDEGQVRRWAICDGQKEGRQWMRVTGRRSTGSETVGMRQFLLCHSDQSATKVRIITCSDAPLIKIIEKKKRRKRKKKLICFFVGKRRGDTTK